LLLGADQARDLDGENLPLARAEEDQSDQQVVPGPEELEDGERGQRRNGHRHDQPPECLEVGRAVDLGRLDDTARQGCHVAAQDEDRQRHAEAGMREPDRGEGAGQTEVAVDPEQGHDCHLQRHDEQSHDQHEQPVTAGELHEGERVGRERGDHERDDGGRKRDNEAVQKGVPPGGSACRRLVQHLVVIVAGPVGERLRDHRPPARAERGFRSAERGHQQADRRHQPEEADHQQDRADQPAGPPGEYPHFLATARLGLSGLRLLSGRSAAGLNDGGHRASSSAR
jgi:hypothetical protein